MAETNSHKWIILVAMGASLGLMVLDETIVGVALPTMRRDLGLTETGSHWVVNAYLVVFAALAAAMGRLGDMVGLRRFFVLGLVIFGATSVAAGFAQNETWIIVARSLQGIGAAIVLPGSMAMMMIVFPPEQRGLALGIYGTTGTVFLAAGPLLGGAFTEYLSWRWIFWVNPFLVVAIAALVLAFWRDPPRQGDAPRLDKPGLVTLVAGVGLLVMGLMQGPDWGWTSLPVLALIVVGVLSLVAFVVTEFKVRAPLIEIVLFANRTMSSANLIIFMAQFSKTSVFIFGALYFQHTLGMNAIEAGLAMLWAVLPLPFSAFFIGPITDRFAERRPALIGLAAMFVSFVWLAATADGAGFMTMVPGLLLIGLTQPVLFVPPMRAVANALPIEKQGQAGGVMLTSQLLGGTIGMTTLGIILVMTNDYQLVFAVTAATCLVIGLVALAWFSRSSGLVRNSVNHQEGTRD